MTDYSDGEFEKDVNGKPIWEERREPLGAPKENLEDELFFTNLDRINSEESGRVRVLEEEQEVLSASLFSLTSHLAQVQFRLRQIVGAPVDEKELMLKALEEFTFRGVPELRHITPSQSDSKEHSTTCLECQKLDEKMKHQRSKQIKFIEQLKHQLKELEALTGQRGSGKGECYERQKVMIDDLKEEIDTNIRENWRQPLNQEEVTHQINCAVRQFVNRQMSKDEIVGKLQEQVDDMQQFIKFLQSESMMQPPLPKSKLRNTNINKSPSDNCDSLPGQCKQSPNGDLRAETINLMRKVVTLLQMFATSQFGCSPRKFYKNDLKKSNIINHWGDLRARLEMSIDSVLSLVSRAVPGCTAVDNYDSESEDNAIMLSNVPLTIAVRKHLATNLRDLLQHGLVDPVSGGTIVPLISCFHVRRSSSFREFHVWELILKYYEINNGESFNSTPARKLSQSFNLDIVGGTAISNKQSMLGAIGSIVASHEPYKRSFDAHFKAFVCAALNARKLVVWLNIILKSKSLIQMYYSPTSYVANTGFQDSLQSLDRLTPFKFDLPVDLAVKQFQNIKDVFM